MDRQYLKEQAGPYFEILRNDSRSFKMWLAQKRTEAIFSFRGAIRGVGNLGSNVGGAAAGMGSAVSGATENAASETASSLYERGAKTVSSWLQPTKARMLGGAIVSALIALFIALFLRVSLDDFAVGIIVTLYLELALFMLFLFLAPNQRYVARVVYADARGVVVDHGGQLEVLKEARNLNVKEGENLIVVVDFAGRRVLATDEYY
jgi:hypothetical protein